MDWWLFVEVAANVGALASTVIAILCGYRAATFAVSDETVEADLRRQSGYAIYAVVASAMATLSYAIALLSI